MIRATSTPAPQEADQPGYARPALLLIAAAAAVLFAWGIDHTGYHVFYANAARSMSESWRGFLFGSFDPGNSITLDKLPGFLWPQALSALIFGFHAWALELPQVVEGVLCVLVLYRVVRVWAGVPAALLAAAAFTLTPVTAGVFRTPAEDAALTLLLLLAAEASQRAARTGRLRTLVMAGVWVGLAFQAKMLEAWVVLPALAVTFLVAAPAPLRRRLTRLGIAGVVMTAVSASWIIVATLTPANDRPYVDGTTDNSAFGMVVGYNFLNRFGSMGLDANGTGSVTSTQGHGGGNRRGSFGRTGANPGGMNPRNMGERSGRTGAGSGGFSLRAGFANGRAQRPAQGMGGRGFGGQEGWNKMVTPAIASQTGWLYPLALVALVVGLAWRRREPRTDGLRAGYLLWGLWLVSFFAVFSAGSVGGHMYYMGVVDVALAALSGAGLVAMWEAFRTSGRRAVALPLALIGTVAWAVFLTWNFPTVRSWLVPPVIGVGVIALVLLAAWRWGGLRRRLVPATLVTVVAATLIAPGAWASSVFTSAQHGASGMGAIGPAQRGGGMTPPWLTSAMGAARRGGARAMGAARDRGGRGMGFGDSSGRLTARQSALLGYVRAHRGGAKYLFATDSWSAASPYILGAGASVLPMGGFTGQVPFPTLDHFRQLVDHGDLHYVLLGGGEGRRGGGAAQVAAITSWVSTACTAVPATAYASSTSEDPSAPAFFGDAAAAQRLYHCG
ncbi:glycosyltransferase family 39 protein [Actinoallomurus sp. CA-150999]|uniref:glycosyltransferase family 39 protein n=1 Tax=Actinoallomurus sp. CA-150999 TaxID=3239887 RepID=UPI003D8C68CE